MAEAGAPDTAPASVIRRTGRNTRPGSLVPRGSIAGRALIFVVAIMTFLACLTAGAVTLVMQASRDWQNDISREVTIQIRDVDGFERAAEVAKAKALAAEIPGLGRVTELDDAATKRLLAPWLGTNVDLTALPVPRLILVEIADPEKADLAELRRQLGRQVTGATLDDHNAWSERLGTLAGTVVAVGFTVLALVLAAMVLSIIFATRAAMAGNRDVVDVLHFVGAQDQFIAREFQRHFLLLGLRGGLIGGAAAALVFLALSLMARSDSALTLHSLFGGMAVGVAGYLAIIGIVALVAALTAATSRLAVSAQLRQRPN